jgi:hypothetical protein
MERAQQAWPAFWLSLAVPGAGQLLARSWTAALWFALVAGLAASCSQAQALVASLPAAWFVSLQILLLFAVGVLSAVHARRLCLNVPRSAQHGTPTIVRCRRTRGRHVSMSIEVPTRLTPQQLWRRISDLPRFLTIDPFHERVTVMRSTPAAGVDLVLDHNAFGLRLRRVGRIVRWREGESYSVSDLSRRDAHDGFPHVFTFRIGPSNAAHRKGAVLHVEIRGTWTSRVIPMWLARLWLVGVCREHAWMLRQHL